MAGQTARRFPFRLGRRTRFVLVSSESCPGTPTSLSVTPWTRISDSSGSRTPSSNLVSWRIEGPWRWITAVGVRLSWRQHDLTFGGTNEGGIRLDLREPVAWHGRQIDALYITVEDVADFTAALSERGLPGIDARGQDRDRKGGGGGEQRS